MGRGSWGSRSRTGVRPELKSAVIAGGSAGNLTVTGIQVGDDLLTVIDVSAASANLASEFTITAADTINNTGGTDTTGMVLLVQWYPVPIGQWGEHAPHL